MPQSIDTNVDLVLCIDCTGSMYPILNTVKEKALGFHEELEKALEEANRDVQQFRIKVIGFRDLCDREDFEESQFFTLPEDLPAFKKFVDGLEATGGGDAPESGLDAIAKAMCTDWVKEGTRKRHIIMVWTDAPTKMPGEQNMYSDLPKSLAEFKSWYQDPQMGKMEQKSKRLIVVGPDDKSWDDALSGLDGSYREIVETGDGLKGMSMEVILLILANSI